MLIYQFTIDSWVGNSVKQRVENEYNCSSVSKCVGEYPCGPKSEYKGGRK